VTLPNGLLGPTVYLLLLWRREPASLAKLWLEAGELPRRGSIGQLWQWLTNPAQADVERAFFESRTRSLSPRDERDADAGPDSVGEWLALIACLLEHRPRTGSRGRHAAGSDGTRKPAGDDELDAAGHSGRYTLATLVLAVLHGLLLDLLATGDSTRVQHAFDLFGTVLDAIIGSADPSQ